MDSPHEKDAISWVCLKGVEKQRTCQIWICRLFCIKKQRISLLFQKINTFAAADEILLGIRFNPVFGFPGNLLGSTGLKQEFRVPISGKLGTQYSEFAFDKTRR